MMAGEILLDTETSNPLQEMANAWLAEFQAVLAPYSPEGPDEALGFGASVTVQAAVRALMSEVDGQMNLRVILGACEGIGMTLGLIAEPGERASVFQCCVRAMLSGMESQARIHPSAGSA